MNYSGIHTYNSSSLFEVVDLKSCNNSFTRLFYRVKKLLGKGQGQIEMIHGFYFRFYNKFHNDLICCILSKIAYFLYCCLYLIKKARRSKKAVNMTYKEAKDNINAIYPRPKSNPICENQPINKDVDLSVIIPVYNHKDIIEDNINFILNQKTDYNYEVILIDDGSTDGVTEIIKQYESNPKVKLIYQENGGIGSARNTGINNAIGKYIMFIDCDDVVHNDIVENLMSSAYENNYDMVMAAHNLVKETDGKVVDIIPNVYSQHNLLNFKNNDKIMNLAGLPWCKVYKRELWNNVRFFPGYWYEDTVILPLIFTQVKKYKYITNIEYEYKWFESNFSHTQNGNVVNKKMIDRYWLYIEIIEQYEKMNLPIDDKFYTLLLRHMSQYYYPTIKNMDEKTIDSMFVLARELCEKYKPNHKVKLPYMLRQVEKAFDNNDIELWKLASCYQ